MLKFRESLAILIATTATIPTYGQGTSSGSISASIPAPTTAAPTQPSTKLQLKTGIAGRSLEDRYVNSKYAGASLDITGERHFSEALSARLDMGVLMAAGSFSNQYTEEGRAPNLFGLNEAALTYKPWNPLALEAGVMITSFSSLPSTFEGLGFPSLRQTLSHKGQDFQASVFATQAIPTSDTAAVKPTENGITTNLTLFGVNASTNPEDRQRLTLSASATRFDFRNLNTSAATDSQYLGNSVVSPGPQARFKYGFGGYEVGSSVAYKITSKVIAKVNGAVLRNEKAPDRYNLGYLYTGALQFPVFGFTVTTSGGYFYNETDTLPASYTSIAKGQNNRFGGIAKIKIEDKKQDASGFVQYIRSNEIEDRFYTADRDIITFGLEASYDIL